MDSRTIYTALLLCFVTLYSCKTAQKPYSYTPEQIVPTTKSLLWKIEGNGLKKPSYLFGTIHVIPKAELKLRPEVDLALKECKFIVFEIDMKEMLNIKSQLALLTKAFMPSGTTLRTLLSPEDYAYVRTYMDGSSLPSTMIDKMKPLFLSTLLGQDKEDGEKAAPSTSVEMVLYKKSNKLKMSTAGLETSAYQLSLFDQIPYKEQAEMLVESLRAAANSSADGQAVDPNGQLHDIYNAEDIQAMQDMMSDESAGMKGFEDILLYKRNANWIKPMGDIMANQPAFFAVGAGHLGGEKGVIALLRKAGYKVEPK
jgi:uncharacterized protein